MHHSITKAVQWGGYAISACNLRTVIIVTSIIIIIVICFVWWHWPHKSSITSQTYDRLKKNVQDASWRFQQAEASSCETMRQSYNSEVRGRLITVGSIMFHDEESIESLWDDEMSWKAMCAKVSVSPTTLRSIHRGSPTPLSQNQDSQKQSSSNTENAEVSEKS